MDQSRVTGQGSPRGIRLHSTVSILSVMILLVTSTTPVPILNMSPLGFSGPLLIVVFTCFFTPGMSSPPATHTLAEATHRLDMILNNTRSRENYIRCFMDRGICNKDALGIKRILSDALATNCSNCTQSQKLGAERFFEYLQAKQPETWDKLTTKYDPAGKRNKDEDEDSDDSDDDDDEAKEGKSQGGSQEAAEGTGGEQGTESTVAANSTITMIF